MPEPADEFPTDDEVVLLNHASFGVPSTRLLTFAEQTRRRVERDAEHLLAEGLVDELRVELAAAADFLRVPPDALAFTQNATEAASAVAASLGRRPGLRVAMADTEYPSVLDAWQIEAAAHGGSVQLVHLDIPARSADEVINAFDRQVAGPLDVLVASLVTSPTALVQPVRRLAQWAAERGALTVVDAAHGPGHIDVSFADLGASVVYGTLHKWLPVPRPLGFLYATAEWRGELRPAMVALHRSEGFAERFMWRGTWDPAPALCFSAGLEEWGEWRSAGRLDEAGRMANLLSARLSAAGLRPTGTGSLLAPRLRGFVVPEVAENDLRRALDDARVRAWAGVSPSGQTLLRLATHVYTTEQHIDRLVAALPTRPAPALSRTRSAERPSTST